MALIGVNQPDMALDLGEQFVVYLDVAVGGATDQKFLLSFHVLQVKLVHFSVVGSSKHLELDSVIGFAFLLSVFWVQVDYNISFAHIHQHVIL